MWRQRCSKEFGAFTRVALILNALLENRLANSKTEIDRLSKSMSEVVDATFDCYRRGEDLEKRMEMEE